MSYSRLIMWIMKDNFLPIVIDYYDEDDSQRCIKRLVESNIKIIDGYPTAMNVVMTNKEDDAQTKMEIVNIEYNIELDDAMFTERGLKK